MGGAASKKYSFERCVSFGRAINDQTVSIGSALDHCHVPGRQSHQAISDDICVVGAGIHNEPVCPLCARKGGYSLISPRDNNTSLRFRPLTM